MENSRIVYLVAGYLNDTLTQPETDELQELLLQEEESEAVSAAFNRIVLNSPPATDYKPEQWEFLASRVLAQTQDGTDVQTAAIKKTGSIRRLLWTAAASVLILAGVGTYFLLDNKKMETTVADAQPEDVLPGRQGALLTLADGSQVLLDTIKNGIVALQGGAMAKVVNGTLLYEGNGKEVVFNTMSTPRGRQFQLRLPDGTQVWLNAASSIRYPTRFTGKERRVEVTGETYFEVARNSRLPFRVSVNNKADVEVLGTNFNINSYDNENSMNTTLLEGSIRVRKGAEAVIIKPGEQAQVSDGIKVEKVVDLEKVMAWKNGFFNFNGLKLEETMRQIERWYEIEVIYEKGVPDVDVGGEMSKDIPLNKLMFILDKLDVHYRMEGRKLIILP
ncbi:FecR family protein [Pseudoflavitalea rhizosphaerae]|uniref:FecR family protein n=1 Tax=Pseudoflavitalea rhizosphaerae TaxID=1884793 RepID=UPI000F8CB112|nr:FecR family protein [Pseudoflavitalea rhizosphaerae]